MKDDLRTASAEELRRAFDAAFARPAEGRNGSSEHLLALRLGGSPYALRLLDVAAFVRAGRVVTLPGASGTLLGLAGVRGNIVPVHDLAALLGHSRDTARPRWLALAGSADPVALALHEFEGHVEVAATLRVRGDATATRRHVQELVRLGEGEEVRAVIDVSSVVRAIEARFVRPSTKES
ncbi:MAG: chemotaxis protein CheW [Polyangiaceae bacterium]